MEMKRPSWLLKPIEEYDELPLEQIALQLSRLNRYAGAVEWSVLQHSLLVWDLVKTESATCQAWALLHDAAECWIGDALLPAKQVAGLAWSNLEETYDGHIQRLAGISVGQYEWQMVRDADKEACRLEMEMLPSVQLSHVGVLGRLDVCKHWANLVTGLTGIAKGVREVQR